MKRRSQLKRKFTPKIKPIKGVTLVYINPHESAPLLDFIEGMGYLLYADPSDDNCAVISDKVLTFGDFKKLAVKQYDLDLDWWNNDTDLNDYLKEELEELTYY